VSESNKEYSCSKHILTISLNMLCSRRKTRCSCRQQFCPGGATWWIRQNIRVVFDSGSFASSFKKRKYIAHCMAVKQDRATGNRYGKFGEIWAYGFWDMRADRQTYTDKQTNRHADRNTSRLTRLPGSK